MAYSEGKNGDESTEITTHNSLEESEGPLTPQHSLSPVITAFLEFSYSNELANTANDFINDHAEAHGFERVKELEVSGEGHPLIWFDIYSHLLPLRPPLTCNWNLFEWQLLNQDE